MWILVLLLGQTPLDRPLSSELLRTRVPKDGFRQADGPELLGLRLEAARRAGGDEAMEAALESLLERLAARQGEQGDWSDGAAGDELATTSRVLLAFSGAGYGTGSLRYGPAVRKGVAWLLRRQDPWGSWGPDAATSALAAAALAEAEVRHDHFGLADALQRARAHLGALQGDSEVAIWASIARPSSFTPRRFRVPTGTGEHAALRAWDDGEHVWRRWLAAERTRLLTPAATASGMARQAVELETPYRFRLWGRRSGLHRQAWRADFTLESSPLSFEPAPFSQKTDEARKRPRQEGEILA